MSDRESSAVILGVYGKGNFGDEALLEVVADDVRQVLPGVELYVFCSGPESVRRRFGFQALTRTPFSDFRRKLEIVRRSRLLVVGGGTLLCDHGGGSSDAIAVVTFFFWLWLARLFGVPTVLYGLGFGPATGRFIRLGIWALRFACSEVTVRDAASYELVSRVAGSRPRFRLGADPVAAADRFLPDTVRQRVAPTLAGRIARLRPFIVLAIRYPKLDSLDGSREHLEATAATAAALCKHAAVNVVLAPTHLSDEFVDDRPVMDLMERALVAHGISSSRISRAAWESLDDAAYWFQSAEMVFGDRLHALLVAALNRVAVAGVAVEDKISGCLWDLFQREPLAAVIEPGDLRKDEIRPLLQGLWDRRGSEPALYSRLLADYRARRAVNVAALERALRSTAELQQHTMKAANPAAERGPPRPDAHARRR
jgi:polysaccharide pyruvyl transferase WcaK-like protein